MAANKQTLAIVVTILMAAGLGAVGVIVVTGNDTSDRLGATSLAPGGASALVDEPADAEDGDGQPQTMPAELQAIVATVESLEMEFPGKLRPGTRWVTESKLLSNGRILERTLHYCTEVSETHCVIRYVPLYLWTDDDSSEGLPSPEEVAERLGEPTLPSEDPGEVPRSERIEMTAEERQLQLLRSFSEASGENRGVDTYTAAGHEFRCAVVRYVDKDGQQITIHLACEYPSLWVQARDEKTIRGVIAFHPGPSPVDPE